MKTTIAEHGQKWAEHVLPMFCACSFHGNSINNLLLYCGLVDTRISASKKDLPVFASKCGFRVFIWPFVF
jgi:hypothetical protein